ncbi:MAG: hypothetical protein GY847_22250, partial [Proteobacteria bacterium]|nr:hypothetical protein [Pseudomonadota bacterium]
MENGKEDPDTPIAAQFAVVEKAYRIWKGQRTRARQPSQSPSSSKSQVDLTKPPAMCIQYTHMLANLLFNSDYDEDILLIPDIVWSNPTDSANNVIHK